MKTTIFLFLFSITAWSQNKKIDFFGTPIAVNDGCVLKESSLKCEKNFLIWSEAPPSILKGMILSMIRKGIKGKKAKEISTDDINVSLLKSTWNGEISKYKVDKNDSIINFVQLTGEYKNEKTLLIIAYKTAKNEPFRVPYCYRFLAEN